MCGIHDDNLTDFSVLKFIILECMDEKKREQLEKKLRFVFHDLDMCYIDTTQRDYAFLHFVNRYPGFSDLDKVDFILTYQMMVHKIPMVSFDQFSFDELLLCSKVMSSYSLLDYEFVGPFLCHEQVVKRVMAEYDCLEEQMKVYQEDMLDCTLCLKHFLKRIDLSKIVGNEEKRKCIVNSLLSIIAKYGVSYTGVAYRKR